MTRGSAVFVMAAAMSAVPAAGASFDCARATTPVEKMVCASPELSTLDEHMARYYAAARLALGEGGQCLQPDQREWLRRRDRCADTACLKQVYADRLAELDGMQPGATAIKDLSLLPPNRPTLVWVIPPAADKAAAPDNPSAKPIEMTGAILDEVATGDGFVLRGGKGERRLLVPLMLLDPATATRLAMVAREASVFRARGHASAEPGGKSFEASRCIYLHRMGAAGEGTVFPDPTQPHPGFKPHELAFGTPRDGVARAEFKSERFFAVILKTFAKCSPVEAERRQAQALFPQHKVFVPRHGCDDSPEENIAYTNVDAKWGFLAVYAGASREEAQKQLAKAKELGRFPGANLREMQAVLVYP